MSQLLTGVRVRAEGLSITSKSVVTFLVLLLDARSGQGNLALLAFAIGQLAYATTLFLAYISHFGTEYLWPKIDQYVLVYFTTLTCLLTMADATICWMETSCNLRLQ